MKRMLTVAVVLSVLAAGCSKPAAPANGGAQPAPSPAAAAPTPSPAAAAPVPSPATAAPAPSPAATAPTPASAPAKPDAAVSATGEVDLNVDGRKERIEGKLGEWHSGPFHIYDSSGHEIIENALPNDLPEGWQHRLTVVPVPGMDRPALVYEYGKPGAMNSIELRWMRDRRLVGASGWHPKITAVHAATVRIETDGTVVATNIPREMGGYTWTRRYRITADTTVPADSFIAYKAELVQQTFNAPLYPTTPENLITAAFIARWYGLDRDLERYIPDPAVRSRFKAAEIPQPRYVPLPVRVGKVTIKKGEGASTDTVAQIEAAPPGPDGKADFLAPVQEYEGGHAYAGPVTFGKAQDGRLVIQQLAIAHTGWEY